MDNLNATERRAKQEFVNNLENVVITIHTTKHKFTCKQIREAKEFKRYVITTSFEDEGVLPVFKRPSRKMQEYKVNKKKVLEVYGKELKSIKIK